MHMQGEGTSGESTGGMAKRGQKVVLEGAGKKARDVQFSISAIQHSEIGAPAANDWASLNVFEKNSLLTKLGEKQSPSLSHP